MKPYINKIDDIMDFLDDQVANISWDDFYETRKWPAPFLIQNELPDENLVEFIDNNTITTAIEFGCGEGRNAGYMAKRGLNVTAYDISSVAIENAKQKCSNVDFHCEDVLKANITETFDFVYDSGMLHHLAPHRRITYIDLLNRILDPGSYFGLTCFSWGDNCGHEVDDWEFYNAGAPGGVAFTKERLAELFSQYFKVIEIRKYREGIENTIQGLGNFMYVCLFQKL